MAAVTFLAAKLRNANASSEILCYRREKSSGSLANEEIAELRAERHQLAPELQQDFGEEMTRHVGATVINLKHLDCWPSVRVGSD